MVRSELIEAQYAHSSLLSSIERGVRSLGKSRDSVTTEDLAKIDEFHIGGSIATEAFLDRLNIDISHKVIDIGSGLGGASRFAAERYGCEVVGIDLTRDYVDMGNVLCSWVGLDKKVQLVHGDATNLTYQDDVFDRAFMLHVGMNIAEKYALASEIHRVLRPGGIFGIYDVMRINDGDITYPVPWATNSEASSVSTIDQYRDALSEAGFQMIVEQNRRDFALDFFFQLQEDASHTEGPPPLGLHLLMGETASVKVRNMIQNISTGLVSPVEMVAKKPTK